MNFQDVPEQRLTDPRPVDDSCLTDEELEALRLRVFERASDEYWAKRNGRGEK